MTRALAAAACLIGSSALAGPQPCKEAKDCHGMLPRFIRKCPDGGMSGPLHWACEQGACVTRSRCDEPPAEPAKHDAQH